MANLEDSNSTSTRDNALVEIVGADGTTITNTGSSVDVNVTNTVPVGVADKNTFTYGSSKDAPIGGVYQDTSPTLTAGQQGAVRLTQYRGFHTNLRDSSGNEITSELYSSFRGIDVSHMDGNRLDAFQRLRTSGSTIISSGAFYNSQLPLLFNQSTSGSATIAYQSTIGAVRLTTNTASGDSAIYQTNEYIRYTPGKSHLIGLSLTLGAKKTNLRSRVGYFDANDGLFFEQTGTDDAITIRSSTSGSPVDTRVAQSSWNLDKLNGTGSSGITLDFTKDLVFIIDFLWFGAGRVRFGFIIGGKIVYCHEYIPSNTLTTTFMRRASLPVRVELTNTGTVSESSTLDFFCYTAIVESNEGPKATTSFSASRGTSSVSATGTIKPLISIRPKLTFNSVTNRVPILPLDVEVLAGSQNTLVGIYLNATLTGASFNSVDTNSAVEFDIASTAVSGGTKIAEFYVAANSPLLGTATSSGGGQGLNQIILGLDIAGSVQDMLTVTATSLAGGTNTWGKINWEEYQ